MAERLGFPRPGPTLVAPPSQRSGATSSSMSGSAEIVLAPLQEADR